MLTETETAWIYEHVLLSHLRTVGRLDLNPTCLCQEPAQCTPCWNDRHQQCNTVATDIPWEAQIGPYGWIWPIRARVWLADRTCRRPCNCECTAGAAAPLLPPAKPRLMRGGEQLALI